MSAMAFEATRSFVYEDLQWPYDAGAYERQRKCGIYGRCPLITKGGYFPALMVPSQLRQLDPAWATCVAEMGGLYDPPRVLQPATAMAAPTAAVSATIANTPATALPSATSPAPASTASAVTQAPYDPTRSARTHSAQQSAHDPSMQVYGSVTYTDSVLISEQHTRTFAASKDLGRHDTVTVPPTMQGPTTDRSSDPTFQANSASGQLQLPSVPVNSKAPSVVVVTMDTAIVPLQPDPPPDTVVVAQSEGLTTTSRPNDISFHDAGNSLPTSSADTGPGQLSDPVAVTVLSPQAPATITVELHTVVNDPASSEVVIDGFKSLDSGQATVLGNSDPMTISANSQGAAIIEVSGSETTFAAPTSPSLAYVIGSRTLVAGGSALIQPSATYSGLISGAGVVVVESGSTHTMSVSKSQLPSIASLEDAVFSGSNSDHVTVLAESSTMLVKAKSVTTTLTPGSKATVNGNIYSLPVSESAVIVNELSTVPLSTLPTPKAGLDALVGMIEDAIEHHLASGLTASTTATTSTSRAPHSTSREGDVTTSSVSATGNLVASSATAGVVATSTLSQSGADRHWNLSEMIVGVTLSVLVSLTICT